MKQKKWLGALCGIGIGIGMGMAHAQMIVVNVADSAAVTFTGTGTFALADYTGSSSGDAFPVRLAGFFTADQSNFDVIADSTTLMTTGADHTLGRAFLRVGAGGPTTLLVRKDGISQENFSTAAAAFTGSATFDLSSFTSALPTSGASGNIFAADGTTLVGTYSVTAVPEPSISAVVFGLGTIAFAAWRKRKAFLS